MASVVSPESPETDSQEELPVRDLRALEREKLRLSRFDIVTSIFCLLYTSPSPRDLSTSRMPSSA